MEERKIEKKAHEGVNSFAYSQSHNHSTYTHKTQTQYKSKKGIKEIEWW